MGKTKVDFEPPLIVKYEKFAGENCNPTTMMHARDDIWVDGPTNLNGVCYVKFRVHNPSTDAQPFMIFKTDFGMNLSAVGALFMSLIMIAWIWVRQKPYKNIIC